MRTPRAGSRRCQARVVGRDQDAAYDGVGGKTDQHLIVLCRNYPDQLHRLPDFSPTWRALGRPAATAKILGVLRSQFRVQDATRP